MAIVGCGGSSDSTSGGAAGGDDSNGTLNLVAYSTPQVVYDQMIPQFKATAAGKGIGFKSSYGPSGDQSRAVEGGQDADVVAFSLAPDMDRLVGDKIVNADWTNTASKGFVSTSVVTFVVRKGNPKGIHTWADLLKPGVKVVTPNPFSSGAAKWNMLAAIGANGDDGKDIDKGLAYLTDLITNHVDVQPASGRDALTAFTSGEGDVLLSYENEAITAQKKGEDVDYVTPTGTIKIENPIAATEKAPAAAKAFVDFALSPAGQQDFADWGYRPVDQAVFEKNKAKFPAPQGLFTIENFGGWDKVNTDLFDAASGKVAKIEEDAGVSTAG
jgi:sulfate transport system substrate-binding protein